MSPSSPIVVMDSGLGGLTVVRAIRDLLPDEDILYFGDTARLPYGSKTAATVSAFVRQIISHLLPHAPKHVVIACNTATALALNDAKASFPELPITGVIEPGAKAAVIAAGSKQVPLIGILATEATIRSKAYEHAIHRRRHHARLLLRPAPLLVPIIEEGRREKDPLVQLAIRQYLDPMVRRGMDVLVLGCTHYPVFEDLIQNIVGDKIPVIDSARQCAEDISRRLLATGMLNRRIKGSDAAVQGTLRCVVTDDPERFQRLAPRFLGMDIDMPAWVAPDELYGTVPVPSPIRISASA